MSRFIVVVAFYQDPAAAARIRGDLRRQGFRRSALVHQTAEGRPRGAKYGLSFRQGARYRRWILPGETMLVVRAPIRAADRALSLLRRSGYTIAAFACGPLKPLPHETAAGSARKDALSPDRLAVHLASAAKKQAITKAAPHGRPLFRQLERDRRVLREIRRTLTDVVRLGQSLTSGAEWILDNAHLIREEIAEVFLNLPARYYRELPAMAGGAPPYLPRAYHVAAEIVSGADSHLDRETIATPLRSYCHHVPLTLGELWALPLMLRSALIGRLRQSSLKIHERQRQHEQADFWANRLIHASRCGPDRLLFMLAEFAQEHPDLDPYFLVRLLNLLRDEPAALLPLQSWLKRKSSLSPSELARQEQNVQAAEQVSLANAVKSLRFLQRLSWRDVVEEISPVEAALREDPAGVYPEMDFATRDLYRHAVEEVARWSGRTENEAARAAIELARARKGEAKEGHVGYYLIGSGRRRLEKRLVCNPPFGRLLTRWIRRHPVLFYPGGIGLLTLLLTALAITGNITKTPALFLLGVLALFPASELAVQAVHLLAARLLPPASPPRMCFRKGIPGRCRTLVTVPTMLLTREGIAGEIERLAIRFLANPDPNLFYALLSDFADAPRREMPGDEALLRAAVEGIKALNERHGDRFFLLHRSRAWSRSEERWIGWERKRGKIEELNWFLSQAPEERDNRLVHAGRAELLQGIRYVLTLDSDTGLPRDTARRLVETMAHPLNQARLAPNGRTVADGYAIIQPLVRTSLPSATTTLFARCFADQMGSDPYCHTVSDLYQDLVGQGTFYGKGLYDVRVFHGILGGRFPEATILSHDLLEGEYVRTGLASEIELFDLFPASYHAYARRQHRWIRGDWQIARWLLPRVPTHDGWERNPLSAISRWKILDNLRRSLVPAASTGMLLAGWFGAYGPGWWSLLPGAALLFPALLKARRGEWHAAGLSLSRALAEAAFLPHQAMMALDAIVRVGYRSLIGHRLMLEWETAGMAERRWRMGRAGGGLFRGMIFCGLGAIAAGAAVLLYAPLVWTAALPYLLLWACSPVVAWRLNLPPRPPRPGKPPAADQAMLRRIARRTWRFFDDLVTEESNWLPPDNYQEALRVAVARRTSPTNIGLWLLSLQAACDFGYVTPEQLAGRAEATLETLGELEKYRGHIFNWYDTETLEPLPPRYISTVDSGNLLASLWAFAEGCRELRHRPLIGDEAWRGLADTLAVLAETAGPSGADEPLRGLAEMLSADPPARLDGIVRRLLQVCDAARGVAETSLASANGETAYWAARLARIADAWIAHIRRYFSWVAPLAALDGDDSVSGLPQEARRLALTAPPSLFALAAGEETALAMTLRTLKNEGPLPPRLAEIDLALSRARMAAGEALRRLGELAEAARATADGIDMRFLYDSERRLLSIGCDAAEGRLDQAFYDLMASEARLASFTAIAKGDVPAVHWSSLGRPLGAVFGRPVLLSWNGTIFEYLMPLLLTKAYSRSLLEWASRAAVAAQRRYCRRRGLPWGISEAAHSALDAHQVYQYRSFGVPGLGLKRGLEDDLVVAPYASALALAVAPRPAVKNLRRLIGLGLQGRYGLYEAIDYTRQRGPEGARGVIVQNYMAHHSGMILVAVNNALHDRIAQARFHRDPRVRACEPLLFERVPTAPHLMKPLDKEGPVRLRPLVPVPSLERLITPETPIPRTHLSSNGSYTVMATNVGGGYSQWRGIDITRWRADTTRDCYGSFCYIKDLDEGALWSTAYHPIGHAGRHYMAGFAVDRVEYHRRDVGIKTKTEVLVAPGDDAEIRRITLTNRSLQTRRLELTSYMELVLAPHGADRAHQAFAKLFVQTEACPELDGLLAWRRRRSPDEPSVWAGHLVVTEGQDTVTVQYETDRTRFIGRDRSLQDPAALSGPLTNTTGAVLDPIFSLRRVVAIEPGQQVRLAFVTVAASTRREVLAMMQKYRHLEAIDAAMEMAWTNAQLELRHLGIEAEDARNFQELGGHALYPNARLRPAAERLRLNTLGQTRLWAYGISGDLPIIVVTIDDRKDLEMVRETLLAHAYLRYRGLRIDLVILHGEHASYVQPLREELEGSIAATSLHLGAGRTGGVFLQAAGQMPPEDLTLLLASARVALVAAWGSLARQLRTPAESGVLPPPLRGERIAEEPSPPLPSLELEYFNGLGGFADGGREYAIRLGPGDHTPAPWINVLANSGFGALISEAGPGLVWREDSQGNRLTPWSNDPVTTPSSAVLYLRDEETGVFWTPTPRPIREDDPYQVRHGQGYTIFAHNSQAIEQELTIFVPLDGVEDGDPVLIQRLRLRNRSSRRRRLTVTGYVEWTLGVDREETQLHMASRWDREAEALLARNSYHPVHNKWIAFAAISPAAASHTADRTEFLGRNGSPERPAALYRQQLAGRTGPGLDPCAALQTAVALAPGEETEVIFLLGQCAEIESLRRLVKIYRDPLQIEEALAATKRSWDHLLEKVQVHTPDRAANILLNRWLLYQATSCRLWARSAFYQSGGAYGFRDQLQDVMALVHTAPELARAHILRAAGRQFVEGDVQHWWHPQTGAGTRTRCSDDLLWLPYVTAHYVRVTGDHGILEARAPFIEGRALGQDESEAYLCPTISLDSASLFEHCQRAIERGSSLGPHGLPLIGSGDWNDGLNLAGAGGRGESVWLAWFTVEVLRGFAGLCAWRGRTDLARDYLGRAEDLVRSVETEAWDGEWYRRAYFDDGSPLGSAACEEWRLDLLPQAWAAIAGVAHSGRIDKALRAAERILVHREEELIALAWPPFDRSSLEPGYIKGYPPGVRENGGQYTHAAIWLALAFARRGDGDRAAALLRFLNPIEHAGTRERAERYRVEPYVVAADVHTAPGRAGQGGWTWYTGAAGWMYRVWLEEVLGCKREGDVLRIEPAMPSAWPGFRLDYRYGGTIYEIVVENHGGASDAATRVELDGQELAAPAIPLVDDGTKHEVRVRLGRARSSTAG